MPDEPNSQPVSNSRKPPTAKQIAARKQFGDRMREYWAAQKGNAGEAVGGTEPKGDRGSNGMGQPSGRVPVPREPRSAKPPKVSRAKDEADDDSEGPASRGRTDAGASGVRAAKPSFLRRFGL